MFFAPLFLSHGGPDVLINGSPAPAVWRAHADSLPRPRAILMMSAHYLALQPLLGSSPRWGTVHDFGGFPRELYKLQYPAAGDDKVLAEAMALLAAAGISARHDGAEGLDHGAWVPLLAMYPQADIPVITISTLPRQDARAHYQLGLGLAQLAEQGVLIIGSGSMTHNLYELSRAGGPEQPWAKAFADWMAQRLQENDIEALLDWEARVPFAKQNHPSDEHLLPLFFALGAGNGKVGRSLHRGIELGALAMDAWAFDGAAA